MICAKSLMLTAKRNRPMDRRKFLSRLSLILSSIIAVLIAIPVVGSLLKPLLTRESAKWRDVGAAEEFEVGKVELVEFRGPQHRPWADKTKKQAAWLKRESKKEFVAFSINCTHLGCPVRWESDPKMFFCPCHGGVFHKDGSVAAGPPPKDLYRHSVRMRNGRVEVQTAPVPITNLFA